MLNTDCIQMQVIFYYGDTDETFFVEIWQCVLHRMALVDDAFF